ncbi:hypothetical protein PRUPE_7G083300 [Prunus persica]|uniref:Uncharacterized protein n=1 Tax=Prunus persica TaxID=3760 RepID=A0A251N8I5_PRUPE|nr:hypothetical protein PRUPE_7G083300 [Prunus persica]
MRSWVIHLVREWLTVCQMFITHCKEDREKLSIMFSFYWEIIAIESFVQIIYSLCMSAGCVMTCLNLFFLYGSGN